MKKKQTFLMGFRKSTVLLGGGGLLALLSVVRYTNNNLIFKPKLSDAQQNRAHTLLQEYRNEFFIIFSYVTSYLGKRDVLRAKKELFRDIDEIIANKDIRQTQLKPEDKELLWRYFIANAFTNPTLAGKKVIWNKS